MCGTGEGYIVQDKTQVADILLKGLRYDLRYKLLQLQFRWNNNYSYTNVNLHTGLNKDRPP